MTALDPYRGAAVHRDVTPRQTWFGRFSFVRRWLGGRWELWFFRRALSWIPLFRWVRVTEFDGRDSIEPIKGIEIDVVARQREDGSIRWTNPDRLWFMPLPLSWSLLPVRWAIGGSWELWCCNETGPHHTGPVYSHRWIPVNRPSVYERFWDIRVHKVETHPVRRSR